MHLHSAHEPEPSTCTRRHGLLPDPESDAICAVFYRVVEEGEEEGALGCVVVGACLAEGVVYSDVYRWGRVWWRA